MNALDALKITPILEKRLAAAKGASAGSVAGATPRKALGKLDLPKSVAHVIPFRTILEGAIKNYMTAETPVWTPLLEEQSTDCMAWMKPGAMEEYWANRLQQDRKDVMSNLFPLVAIFRSSSAEAERAFSSAGFIVDSLRTRMRPEVVRVLTVGRSVLHDVHEVDGKKAVYTFIPNTTSSTTEGETFKVTGELHHLFLSDKKN